MDSPRAKAGAGRSARPAAALLLAAALAAPARADSPPVEAAGMGALLYLADPRGTPREPTPAYGLRAGLALPVLPRQWFLRADVLWLHAAREEGTDAVRVATSLDTFGLPLSGGYEWRVGHGVWLAPYLAAGPTLVRTGIRYRVDDPLAAGAVREAVADFAPGAVYGAGGRMALAAGEGLALSVRVEALGWRRGVADDRALVASLGLLFGGTGEASEPGGAGPGE